MSVKAGPDKFWGGKVQGDQAVYAAEQKEDDFVDLREYLEQEEVLYIIRQDDPRALTIYYDYGEEDRAVNNWNCKVMNNAFPKAKLKSLVFADINDVGRGKSYFDC